MWFECFVWWNCWLARARPSLNTVPIWSKKFRTSVRVCMTVSDSGHTLHVCFDNLGTHWELIGLSNHFMVSQWLVGLPCLATFEGNTASSRVHHSGIIDQVDGHTCLGLRVLNVVVDWLAWSPLATTVIFATSAPLCSIICALLWCPFVPTPPLIAANQSIQRCCCGGIGIFPVQHRRLLGDMAPSESLQAMVSILAPFTTSFMQMCCTCAIIPPMPSSSMFPFISPLYFTVDPVISTTTTGLQ